MSGHDDQLLSVLNKIGQAATVSVDASAPAVLDADTVVAQTDKKVSGLGDPPIASPAMVGEIQDRKFMPVSRKNLFVHHDAHPVVYDVALLQKYQTHWLDWEPETLWREIRDDFRVPSISDHAKAKIQAVRTIHMTDGFWQRWEVFCWCTQALNNNIPDWHVLQKPTVSQIMNSVDICGVVHSGEIYSPELRGFIAACLIDQGIFYAPHPIEFMQDELLHYLEDRQISDYRETIRQVQEKYRQVIKIPDAEWRSGAHPILQENAVDIQVAKLKVAFDYLNLRHQQLKDQLLLLT